MLAWGCYVTFMAKRWMEKKYKIKKGDKLSHLPHTGLNFLFD